MKKKKIKRRNRTNEKTTLCYHKYVNLYEKSYRDFVESLKAMENEKNRKTFSYIKLQIN